MPRSSVRRNASDRMRSARRIAVVVVGWLLAILIGGCANAPRPEMPTVVNGVLDASRWNFAVDGPLPLRGDWTFIGEVTGETAAHGNDGAPNDFVALPWSEAGHRTRDGHDVDAFPSVALRARILLGRDTAGAVIHVSQVSAEAYHLRCRDDGGTESTLAGGIRDPKLAASYTDGLWPRGSVALARSGECTLVIPRAAMNRVRFLDAPLLVNAANSERAFVSSFVIAVIQVVFTLTCLYFAAVMTILNPRDLLARRSLFLAIAFAIRAIITNRGELFSAETLFQWRTVLNARVEYADLYLGATSFVFYAETIAGEKLPLRRAFTVLFLALAVAGTVLDYSGNRTLLPLGQGALLVLSLNVCRTLYRHRSDRVAFVALLGVVTVFASGLASAASVVVFGTISVVAEVLSTIEPLFQMAVIAMRTAEARAKSSALALATQQFVPSEFLNELGHADVTTAKLGDVTSRPITVLFADIRNFTTLSEQLSAQDTFALLNHCLSRVGPHIRANSGFVDKYIGDAIMALFPRSPHDAVRAAVAMQRELAEFNASDPNRFPVHLGIGIHGGPVMMGTIGEARRFEATVIGDAVNLAARIESLTKNLGCKILISEAVAADLPEDLEPFTRPLGAFAVKGKSQAVALVEVFASDLADDLRSKVESRDRLAIVRAAHARGDLVEALTAAGELQEAYPSDGPIRWWFERIQADLITGQSAGEVVFLDGN